jgi:hypothetical protein
MQPLQMSVQIDHVLFHAFNFWRVEQAVASSLSANASAIKGPAFRQ